MQTLAFVAALIFLVRRDAWDFGDKMAKAAYFVGVGVDFWIDEGSAEYYFISLVDDFHLILWSIL